uniref:Uncharacterized protein n=1 Tax=Anguilla anguilla TaxID=7936 RepID=A0A0E9USS3_ANGAN
MVPLPLCAFTIVLFDHRHGRDSSNKFNQQILNMD